MPMYDLALVLKVLPRPELSAALKRVGQLLIEKGACVQKLENHGTRDLPYKFKVSDVEYYKGSYFIYSFLSKPTIFADISDECKRDVDILRHHIGEAYHDLATGCTLQEELKPPALRKSVQQMLEISKKNKERTKPYYKHVKTYNYFDIYM